MLTLIFRLNENSFIGRTAILGKIFPFCPAEEFFTSCGLFFLENMDLFHGFRKKYTIVNIKKISLEHFLQKYFFHFVNLLIQFPQQTSTEKERKSNNNTLLECWFQRNFNQRIFMKLIFFSFPRDVAPKVLCSFLNFLLKTYVHFQDHK